MLTKLLWFALGAGVMRYTMTRQTSSLGSGATGRGQLWGSGAAGGSAGRGQGLQQSALSGDDMGAGMSGSMRPDEDQDSSLQPASSGTGIQGARSNSGEQGAEKAYT